MRLTITTIAIALIPASWALAVTSTTVSFQNGVNSYSDTFDRYIFQVPGGGVDGSTIPDFTLQGGGAFEQQGLIRFDNIFGNNPGQIPLGAKILDASLQLTTIGGPTTGNTDNSNGPFAVAGLTGSFGSSTVFADYAGGRGAWFEDNHSTRPQGNYGRLDLGETQRTDIRSIVQQWSDQTLANNGLVVNAGFPSGNDTWRILTTGNATAGVHPKLNVTYTMDNVAINTFQNGTNGTVDSARVTSLCNGTGTGCTMPHPTGGTYPTEEVTTDGNTIGSMTLQLADASSSEQFALFRFNDMFGSGAGQSPADKPVSKAWLVLTTLSTSSSAARIPAPVDAYELAQPWTLSKKYSDFGANRALQSGDGDITQDTLYRTPSAANDSEIWFDVTDYAERLRNGAANNGIAIQSRSTDAWQFSMGGAGTIANRPRLVLMSDLSAGAASLGDFNNDTKVDARDYVTWRKNDANAALPNDNGLGNQAARYDLWRANFGNTGSVAAPQPTTVLKYNPSAKNEVVGTTMPDLPAASTPSGVTGLTLVRGAGITAAGLTNGFSSNSWTNATTDGVTPSRDEAIARNDYYEWGITLDASHTASLSALDLSLRRSSAFAASNFELQASLDNFTTPIVVSNFTYMGRADGDAPLADPTLDPAFGYMSADSPGRPDTTFSPSDPIPQIDLSSIAALQNIAASSTVKFRLYAWGATSETSTVAFRIHGPKLTGIVSATSGLGSGGAVPEPSSMLLAGICATWIAIRRPRRFRD